MLSRIVTNFSFNDRIETRKAHFFFRFVLLRAKRSFQTRVSSNKNTQSERRFGGTKIFAPSILILPKTHTQTHIVRALRELRCRCSFAYHLRCSSSFFFLPSCIQTLATTTRAKRRSASCEEFFLCLVLFLLSFHWIQSLFAEERTNGANETIINVCYCYSDGQIDVH